MRARGCRKAIAVGIGVGDGVGGDVGDVVGDGVTDGDGGGVGWVKIKITDYPGWSTCGRPIDKVPASPKIA